jgi:hypothetical protein
MIFVDHHFQLHQIKSKKYKKYFPENILHPNKRSISNHLEVARQGMEREG